ncbi:uncharacterized protein LOC135847454 isoform X2 [Planococcus citri]|uniref:uncharacterized protein LOC135847454 isoform X2 n=1 Tax=Planococcus citri TaxID=170843 RepID=UPI0031F9CA2B
MDPNEESLLTKNQIPIIDLSHIGIASLIDPPKNCCVTMRKIASQLEKCLREKGLALLVNHGIPQHKLTSAYREMETFRKSCKIDKDTFQYCSDDIITHSLPHTCPPYGCYTDCYKEEYHLLDMRWLDDKLPENEGFQLRDTMQSLSADFQKVSLVILQALAMALDVDSHLMVGVHNRTMDEKNRTGLQILYSLRQGKENESANPVQLPKPEDLNTFTLLAQDPDSNFEVQVSENKWMKVGHLPGAILFHAGQHLQNWTAGKYKFLQTRIMTPEETLLQLRSGYCTMFKVQPDTNAVLDPILFHLSQIPESTNETKHSHKRYMALFHAVQQIQRRLKLTKISDAFHFVNSTRYWPH